MDRLFCLNIWEKLFGGTVPPNKPLFGGTVTPNYPLFGCTVIQIIRYLEVHIQMNPLLELLSLQLTYYFKTVHLDFGIVGDFRRKTTPR